MLKTLGKLLLLFIYLYFIIISNIKGLMILAMKYKYL